jgi:hypothetical protein
MTKCNNRNEKEQSEIIFLIRNLEFLGTEKTYLPNGGFKRDHIIINIHGHEFIIKEFDDYRKRIESLRNGIIQNAITSKMIIKEHPEKREGIIEMVDNLCSLMSFLKGNFINYVKEIHMLNGKIVHEKSFCQN